MRNSLVGNTLLPPAFVVTLVPPAILFLLVEKPFSLRPAHPLAVVVAPGYRAAEESLNPAAQGRP